MVKDRSSVTSLTATTRFRHTIASWTIRRSTSMNDLTSVGTAIQSFWSLQLWLPTSKTTVKDKSATEVTCLAGLFISQDLGIIQFKTEGHGDNNACIKNFTTPTQSRGSTTCSITQEITVSPKPTAMTTLTMNTNHLEAASRRCVIRSFPKSKTTTWTVSLSTLPQLRLQQGPSSSQEATSA